MKSEDAAWGESVSGDMWAGEGEMGYCCGGGRAWRLVLWSCVDMSGKLDLIYSAGIRCYQS